MQWSSKGRTALFGKEDSESVRIFEDQLGPYPRWALSEGSRFFEGQGAVQETLRSADPDVAKKYDMHEESEYLDV